ncbi:hypothetical protein Slala03_50850 [Streptomyces lavendulae subsp. lavendulae]|nr:hypothetical protein Slala03_50850 [Streptomyces lavendulae subsp. lavendulae]
MHRRRLADEPSNADSQHPEQEGESGDPFHPSHAETEVAVGEEQSEGGDRRGSQQAGAPPQKGRYVFRQADPRQHETDVARCHDEEGAQDMLVLVDVRGSQTGQDESHSGTGEQQAGDGSGPAPAPQETTGQGRAQNEQHPQSDEGNVHQAMPGGADIPRLRL